MRLIDADALDIRKYTIWFENEEDVRQVKRMIREAPTITRPPNAPLTLEQLWEMDGEPVWIAPVKGKGKIPARWMLISGYHPEKDIYLFTPNSNILQGYNGKSYGKMWLAYRRKP